MDVTRYATYYDACLGHGQSVPLDYLELGYWPARLLELENRGIGEASFGLFLKYGIDRRAGRLAH